MFGPSSGHRAVWSQGSKWQSPIDWACRAALQTLCTWRENRRRLYFVCWLLLMGSGGGNEKRTTCLWCLSGRPGRPLASSARAGLVLHVCICHWKGWGGKDGQRKPGLLGTGCSFTTCYSWCVPPTGRHLPSRAFLPLAQCQPCCLCSCSDGLARVRLS